MAEFRNIHTRIWADSWFCELCPDEKLLFIYLFSNPAASVCGMYELPNRTMSLDTGLALDRVSEILDTFSKAGKVHYEDGVIWVVNLKKYNSSGDSIKVLARARKDLEILADSNLKRMYFEYENHTLSRNQDTLSEKVSRDESRRDESETETRRDETTPLADDYHSEEPDEFERIRRLLVTVTGVIGSGRGDIQAIDEIIKIGAIDADILAATQWAHDQGKTIRYFSSLVGPIATAKAKRIQGGNGKPGGRVVPGRTKELIANAEGNLEEFPA